MHGLGISGIKQGILNIETEKKLASLLGSGRGCLCMVQVRADMHQGVNSDLMEVIFDCMHQIQNNLDIDIEVESHKATVADRKDYSLGCEFKFDMDACSIGNYSYGEVVEELEEEIETHPKVTRCSLEL